ncbi:MAG TPA: histidinol-phosphate transaminase [Burkholderiales bacterium]|nr:histidinol-phosphate transaminase [Burkholderiales bacterium]
MSHYWSVVVHGLTPYVPGEQPRIPDLIKLNTNENPYGPSPRVLDALRAAVSDTLRLYPDPFSERLRQALALLHGVAMEQVFVGNGSDEVLAHTFQALLKHDTPLLFPDVTYSFYPAYCRLYGIAFREVPLTASFEVAVEDYRQPNGGIILPNPNAPTGRIAELSGIERLLQANKESVVVIDEAYVDFGGESTVPLVSRYANLLVTRTLSKSHALAGLRVGYAIGHPQLIEALTRVKDSFNSYPLDRLAQAGALAAIEDAAHVEANCRRVIASRVGLAAALEGIGFEVVPSAANFVLARYPGRDGAELTAQLRERGIIVRHFRAPPRIAPYMRITVGTDSQCDALISALRNILS